MDDLQELNNAISNGTIPDPIWPPLPRDWGFAQINYFFVATYIISRTGKATDFKFGEYIYRANVNKIPLKFWRKGSVGNFSGTPYYLKNG